MPARARKSSASKTQPASVEGVIQIVRGERVILDSDLARLYGVETKMLNRAIKRNRAKFPPDFMFQLTADEFAALRFQSGTSNQRHSLRSQIVTSKPGRGGRRYLPFACTEHGAIMAANILNSPQAVQMSVFVVRAKLEQMPVHEFVSTFVR